MKALLALEDGFVLQGRSFTGPIDLAGGEVIFNTAMTGYQELLTDPSYAGQMVCMTWPLAGNYGINPEDMESGRVHLSALLVKECCKEPSNWRARESLPGFLARQGVPGVEGLDTRALTLRLRTGGAMRGAVSTAILDPDRLIGEARRLPGMEGQNLVERVAPAEPYRWDPSLPGGGKPAPAGLRPDGSYAWPNPDAPGAARIVVYDYGVKWNILRLLAAHGMDLLVVPPAFSPEQVGIVRPDGIFLTNGPGDPATLTREIAIIARLAETWPMAGICLGHQLLGHALGGSTAKLKFGHHGVNHPVKNLLSDKIEISSQNHGFHVLPGKGNIRPTHVNLNDHTLEGFRHPTKPIITVQHHPEAACGPGDCRSFFAAFRDMVLEEKAKRNS
ncbi:MAG: glutamine-hydrolyzing carbamoyl-phosphate synthase small subunit [Desulfovibrio sp.]|jgi:carbamoyl-phosphate synthase small subunit|nr:glutamine-hydrolyzing carbamoyl-phosphate synthase small subunit [Desulfovibrio sp.]